MLQRSLPGFHAASHGALLSVGWLAMGWFTLQAGPVPQQAAGPPDSKPAPVRIRVGGSVQQAKLLVKVHPKYPPEAKAKGIHGMVRLQATIDQGGKVKDLQVLGGNSLLATAAVAAVRKQQYAQTILDGNAVEVVTEVDVNFTLVAPPVAQTALGRSPARVAGRPVTTTTY